MLADLDDSKIYIGEIAGSICLVKIINKSKCKIPYADTCRIAQEAIVASHIGLDVFIKCKGIAVCSAPSSTELTVALVFDYPGKLSCHQALDRLRRLRSKAIPAGSLVSALVLLNTLMLLSVSVAALLHAYVD